MKKALQNQLWLFRFCLKSSPKLLGFHLFLCVEIELFIFLEYTVWIGYNLNAAESGAPFSQVLKLTAGIFLLFLIHQLIDSVYYSWAVERIKPALVQSLRRKIYEKAQSLDLSCYDNADFYNEFILSTTQSDQCIDRFLTDSHDFIRRLVQSVLLTAFLSASDRTGLAVALLCCVVKYLSCRFYYRLQERVTLEKLPLERKRDYQRRVFYLHDYAKDLRQYPDIQPLLTQDFDACNDDINGINKRYRLRLWALGVLKSYLSDYFLLYALYLPYLLRQVMEAGTLSVSMLVILLASVRRLANRSCSLVELFPRLSLNSTFVEKIRSFLSCEPQICDGSDEVRDRFESLSLSHVSFSYRSGAAAKASGDSVYRAAASADGGPEQAAPSADGGVSRTTASDSSREILHDVSMEIRRGQKIALVGYNGAGKTTLVKLLMRLYDPDSGTILRNGKDIRTLKLDDYRQGIGAVFQDYKIYAASIRENVVMDICTMDRQETYDVENALFQAKFNLTERRLKYQIETPLTTEFEKDGVNLSGGESQKVAIARTLYRRQDLIIMDEPSSALDPSAEYQLNRELQEIAKDRTVIFISHRLSAARDADRIYMMKQGRIVEQGTHEQLLALDGEYSQMWRLQAEGYR